MMRKGLCAFSGMLFLLLSASQLQADDGFARLVIYSNGSETALAALNGPAKLQTLCRGLPRSQNIEQTSDGGNRSVPVGGLGRGRL